MNIQRSKLIPVIILTMTVLSCGERDITGPDDDGLTIFDLEVTSIGLEIILSWDAIDNSSLNGYNIYRQVDDGGFLKYDSVTAAIISYTDNSVTAELRYEYQITAMLNEKESERSETVRIIPGLTTTWVLDNSTILLSELTHDVAHRTGKFFDNLPFVTAFDVDEKNGYIYLLNGEAKTLMLYVEGQTPSSLTNSDSTITTFEDPSDLDYDSVRDDMWVADGSSGMIYHYSETEPGKWVLADTFNTGGSADEGQIDINNGDYWAVNNIGASVEIYQNFNSGYNRISIGGFSTEGIILALDEKRVKAYAVDIGTGTVSVITATGIKTNIAVIEQTKLAVVEPESGDLWILANNAGSYDLIKLSVIGLRIFTINTGISAPRWMGVNSQNMNIVILNDALEEPKALTFDKFGESINTFIGLTSPYRGRILKLD